MRGKALSSADLFVEILLEELPAVPFLREFENFKTKWDKVLGDYELGCASEFFYTPRRLVILARDFPLRTQDKEQEVFGPPVEIAFVNGDKSGALSNAGEAFLKKNNLSRGELGFALKDNREVLYAKSIQKGRASVEFVAEMVEKFLASLHFGKHMRWGSVKESFIRPIRNIMIFLGEEFVKSQAYGLDNAPKTLVHRDFGFEYHEVKSFAQYEELLKNHGVVLRQEERKNLVLAQIRAIEKESGLYVELDEELLSEVVAITESPRALLGSFDAKFLELPKEVIVTSMKENQRYFALYQDSSHEKLAPHFIVVSNSTGPQDEVILAGNEKVLKARLEDAMFFYHNDLKRGLQTEGLEKLVFIEGAGSMADKVARERVLALALMEKFLKNRGDLESKFLRAVELSKADLLSEMVYEFPNLQGLMGYYYALHQGEDESVAEAIKEQYLPLGEDSDLPSCAFSAILALAHKLDNIFTLFAIGKIPTGSKDPFALRRAASGILRIVKKYNFPFDLKEDLPSLFASVGYGVEYPEQIRQFFLERLGGILGGNPSLLRSVLATGENDVVGIFAKTLALGVWSSRHAESLEILLKIFKRVANILKDVQNLGDLEVNEELFECEEERELFRAFKKAKDDIAYLEECRSKEQVKKMGVNIMMVRCESIMKELTSLDKPLDAFFDGVMVNVENPALRQNRIALIAKIYEEFLQVADIKEISL